jgi:hypothetical protein
MFNAKPLQVGFVLLQSACGFVAFHKANIATLVAGTRNTRFLRLVERAIPRLAA